MRILLKLLTSKWIFFGVETTLCVYFTVRNKVLFTEFAAVSHDDQQCWSSWSFSSVPSSSLPNRWSTKKWTSAVCAGCGCGHTSAPPSLRAWFFSSFVLNPLETIAMQDYELYYTKILHCKGIKKKSFKEYTQTSQWLCRTSSLQVIQDFDSGEKEKTKIGLFAVKWLTHLLQTVLFSVLSHVKISRYK